MIMRIFSLTKISGSFCPGDREHNPYGSHSFDAPAVIIRRPAFA